MEILWRQERHRNIRAKNIEKVCKIYVGQEELCSADISDSLTLVELPNGFVLTKTMARGMGYI